MEKENIRLCPKCKKELIKQIIPGYRMIFKCEEHGLFRVVVKRQKNMMDSRNWKSKCIECGGIMDYYNFVYHCRKCGNYLEV